MHGQKQAGEFISCFWLCSKMWWSHTHTHTQTHQHQKVKGKRFSKFWHDRRKQKKNQKLPSAHLVTEETVDMTVTVRSIIFDILGTRTSETILVISVQVEAEAAESAVSASV